MGDTEQTDVCKPATKRPSDLTVRVSAWGLPDQVDDDDDFPAWLAFSHRHERFHAAFLNHYGKGSEDETGAKDVESGGSGGDGGGGDGGGGSGECSDVDQWLIDSVKSLNWAMDKVDVKWDTERGEKQLEQHLELLKKERPEASRLTMSDNLTDRLLEWKEQLSGPPPDFTVVRPSEKVTEVEGDAAGLAVPTKQMQEPQRSESSDVEALTDWKMVEANEDTKDDPKTRATACSEVSSAETQVGSGAIVQVGDFDCVDKDEDEDGGEKGFEMVQHEGTEQEAEGNEGAETPHTSSALIVSTDAEVSESVSGSVGQTSGSREGGKEEPLEAAEGLAMAGSGDQGGAEL